MMTPRGEKRHLVNLQAPGTPVPDGEGGFIETMAALNPPQMFAQILPATARSLERVTAGTTLSSATHIVTMDYHDGVNSETQILFEGRTFYVRGVSNPEERDIETIAICEEVVA